MINTQLLRFALPTLFLLSCIVGCSDYQPSGIDRAKKYDDSDLEKSLTKEEADFMRNKVSSLNNIKRLNLAIHQYAQEHKGIPPAYSVDKDGKPLLSWRVLILPYLPDGSVYNEFHLDEPWNSDHNKKLIEKMPDVFKSPLSKVANQGKTNYLTIRGERTIFPGNPGIKFSAIKDGLSNTLMTLLVADESAVVWTKPDDFAYDEQDPVKGLVGLCPDGFIAGFADASGQFLKTPIDPETLLNLYMRDDGNDIDIKALD